ncbi:ABC transporter substrate-binding protein [Aquihabitans sp. G128]|uniref:ABC transporter substrate-binding protein n=1 Tax=Aquihabitans sp. G128 TaxID=2849779 RepID=UPI001C21B436|nr:ABC transporter substrate-binding protein [Aquihabitans sp. G128]QXC63328.1 ABC transporter substrate-binding protein [Aquihabitans sp. G128]
MRRPLRFRSLAVVGLLLVAVTATACGSDGTDATSDDETTTTAEGTGSGTAGDGAFPVTIDHAFGSVTIDEAPKRVVSVGYTEQDVLLALDVTPVGVTDWYGDQPHATWPWAQDELGDAKPEVLSIADGFQYEKIAALKPDLIVGTNAGMEEDSYEKLSAIAPTLAQKDGAEGYFSEWDDQTLMIGRAVGKAAEAEDLVDGVKADFAAAAKAHPEWAGKQVVFLQNAFYEGNAIAYQDGLSTDFLTDLGFEVPKVLDDYVTEDGGQAYIPIEKLSVLDDADLLIWGTEAPSDRGELEKEPLYRALEPVQDGHLVFTDGETAGAIYFTSVLSLPYVLDQLVPALEQALGDGGPATIGGK